MHIKKLNREILLLPASHPAHRFLRAFAECRMNCVGREACNNPVDQEWFSQLDGRRWSYSQFAYRYLAFDIVLYGWLRGTPGRTPDEERWIAQFPRWRELLLECKNAAELDNNHEIIPILTQVFRMLDLWEECILQRDTASDDDYPHRADEQR